jgi:hypothetical protein
VAKKKKKKKGAAGRARGSSDAGGEETSQARRPAAVQQDHGAVEPAAPEDRSILDQAELQRLVTQAVAQALEALRPEREADRDRVVRIEAAITTLGQQIESIAPRLTEAAAPTPDQGDVDSGRTKITRVQSETTRRAVTHARRQDLWISELNQSSPLPKPRPTIVGRALADLGATSRDAPLVSALTVFRHIREADARHLDQNAIWNLGSATSLDAIERNRATSGLTKLFDKRFERLVGAYLADEDRGQRWLTSTGKDVFDGWPDWQVDHDDKESEGTARPARRRPEGAAAEAIDGQEPPVDVGDRASDSGPSE